MLAYPRADRQYTLITDASFGDEHTAGGLSTILTQIDKQDNFYIIAYASRKLQKHEKNYTPFLLEMQAAISGMETFEVHLKGRQFKLFTDHKLLKKLGKVHTKTLNRLQQMMNLFSFEIIYKKGEEMPADFLSRNAVDAISSDLHSFAQEQNKYEILQHIRLYLLNRVLPDNNKIAQLVYKMAHDCFVLNGVVWKRLGSNLQHRSVLMVPQHLIKNILAEAHGHLLSGHFGVSKTKHRILQSYYWPNMDKDIIKHLKMCDKCQVTKTSKVLPELLSPLPQCMEPNQRIHADLFGPLKTMSRDKKFILCLTVTFTKYVELVTIPNKEAFTVAMAILNRWICRFGLPLEIVTDQGKEFTNLMAQQLFKALNIKHSTTSSYHPQCNSQAEVCNKTIAKYLAAFVDSSTLDWEPYVPALMFTYNTSFHRSIQATPFRLEARLPAFFAPDFCRLHDPDLADNDLLSMLHHARDLAVQNNLFATDKQKEYFDRQALHHTFHEGQFVLLNEFNFLNKNRKLAPKYSGPFKILRVKGPHNVELLLTNGRKIVVNVAHVKKYFSPETTSSENSHEEIISTRSPNEDVIPSNDFQPQALTPSHTRRPGRPAGSKVLSPSDVSFSKTRREKDRGEGENEEYTKNEMKNKHTHYADDVYANSHPMTTRAAVERRHQDAQVTVSPIESTEMDNSGNIVTLDAYDKLNNIIRRTYQCVTDKKKKKKLLHNTKLGQLQEDWDTYKYSEYPESGISPDQHAPPAAAGQPAAAPAASAPPAASAAALPAAAAAGGVPLLAAAPAGPVHPAAPPGPLPFAAAAALPADAADFALPAEWQNLYPLPPDSSDSSVTVEFFDAASANSTQDNAAALGEDSARLEGQGAQDHGAHHLETDPNDHHPEPRGAYSPFWGFPTPPR